MKNHIITPEAGANILDIIDFIAKDNPAAADKVLAAFESTFEKLGDSPGMGHYREELLNQRHRFSNVYSYLIVYRWEVKPIQIIAVVHGARDLDSYFRTKGIQ